MGKLLIFDIIQLFWIECRLSPKSKIDSGFKSYLLTYLIGFCTFYSFTIQLSIFVFSKKLIIQNFYRSCGHSQKWLWNLWRTRHVSLLKKYFLLIYFIFFLFHFNSKVNSFSSNNAIAVEFLVKVFIQGSIAYLTCLCRQDVIYYYGLKSKGAGEITDTQDVSIYVTG